VLALATGIAVLSAGIAMGDDPATVSTRSFEIDAGTKLGQIDFPNNGVPVPTTAPAVVITNLVNFGAISPAAIGLRPFKGRVKFTSTCFGSTDVNTSAQVKLDRGYGIVTQVMEQTNECIFYQTQPTGRGGARSPWDSTGSLMLSVQPYDPSSACEPDKTTMCLGPGSRFRVEATWRDGNKTRDALAFPTAADTGTFYFFNPDNVDMVVRILDQTNLAGFNNFWVFAGGLTDVEVTLTVTDTVTAIQKVYSGPPGGFASVGDTSAF
jgi:hypothetical protein